MTFDNISETQMTIKIATFENKQQHKKTNLPIRHLYENEYGVREY